MKGNVVSQLKGMSEKLQPALEWQLQKGIFWLEISAGQGEIPGRLKLKRET